MNKRLSKKMNTPPEYDKKKNSQRLREGLRGHVEMIAQRGRLKYPSMEKLEDLYKMISDSEILRFPTSIVFVEDALSPREAVKLKRNHDTQDESYIISLNSSLRKRELDAVMLALYVIVNINYGKIAKKEEAEMFGSALLGVSTETYGSRVESLKKEFRQDMEVLK